MDTYIMRVEHEDRLSGRPWRFAIAIGDWAKMEDGARQGCLVDAKLKMGERLATEHKLVLGPRDYQAMEVSVWRYPADDGAPALTPERVA